LNLLSETTELLSILKLIERGMQSSNYNNFGIKFKLKFDCFDMYILQPVLSWNPKTGSGSA